MPSRNMYVKGDVVRPQTEKRNNVNGNRRKAMTRFNVAKNLADLSPVFCGR